MTVVLTHLFKLSSFFSIYAHKEREKVAVAHMRVLGERYVHLMSLQICRLSMTLLHGTHRVEQFGDIFAPNDLR